ncbi:MAG: threonine-phosphate decarboxylase CobD [Hyphomicrobiales bacterium]
MKSEPVTIDPLDPQRALESLVVHGGRLFDARHAFPKAPEPWIDLSTGINPAPYPVGEVSEASWTRLPEENEICALEAAAAHTFGARFESFVIAAPGTETLIHLLPRLFPARHVAILGFTYSEHQIAWETAGAVVDIVSSIDDLLTTDDFDTIVVVNPNNPCGRLVDPKHLTALASKLARKGGRLIVDEAFMDLMEDAASFVHRLPNEGAVILRSFGKTFGLAGLRLGFALAGSHDGEKIRAALGSWPISGASIEIGLRAYGDTGWLTNTMARLEEDCEELDAVIEKLGLKVIGGTPLYRLAEGDQAQEVFQRLAQSGILVRAFKDKPNWLRFGIPGGDTEVWDLLIERVRKLLPR